MATSKRDYRFALGISGTVAWIGVAACMYFNFPHPSKLNEWGDAIAGFFAPVAILWLVLGYLQQREEIRNAAAALEAEQKSRRDAACPVFILTNTGTSSAAPAGMIYNLELLNAGNLATNVVFRYEPALQHNQAQSLPIIQRGEKIHINLPWQAPFTTSAHVSYLDADGIAGEVAIPLEGSQDGQLRIGATKNVHLGGS